MREHAETEAVAQNQSNDDNSEESLSELQRRIVDTAIRLPDARQWEIARLVECDRAHVSRTLAEHAPDHSSVGGPVTDGPTDLQTKIIETAKAHWTATSYNIADWIDCDRSHVNRTLDEYYPDHPSAGAYGRNSYNEHRFLIPRRQRDFEQKQQSPELVTDGGCHE